MSSLPHEAIDETRLREIISADPEIQIFEITRYGQYVWRVLTSGRAMKQLGDAGLIWMDWDLTIEGEVVYIVTKPTPEQWYERVMRLTKYSNTLEQELTRLRHENEKLKKHPIQRLFSVFVKRVHQGGVE